MSKKSILVTLFAALNVTAESSTTKELFLKHWKVAKEFTLAVAEAMPTEGYDFKPAPGQLTFGYLMVHLADENSTSCGRATGSKPIQPPSNTDKPSAIRYLTETFDACTKAVEAMPADRLEKVAYQFQNQPVLAYEALWYTFTHMAHHRGQAEVYLRVKNIKPPAWRF